jgi:cation transporter-like permease
VAPLDDRDKTTNELRLDHELDLAVEANDHREELLRIKVQGAIAAAPVAFAIGWGVFSALHLAPAPADWVIALIAPIISTALTQMGSSILTRKKKPKS